MFGLAMGISRISTTLPGPVYALLSGLNAATVGVIALAGAQLAKKAITGPLTRLLVVGTGCAGICYNALWYFPVILVIDGMITLLWTLWYNSAARLNFIERRRRYLRHTDSPMPSHFPEEPAREFASVPVQQVNTAGDEKLPQNSTTLETPAAGLSAHSHGTTTNPVGVGSPSGTGQSTDVQPSPQFPSLQVISVKASIALAVAFFGE